MQSVSRLYYLLCFFPTLPSLSSANFDINFRIYKVDTLLCIKRTVKVNVVVGPLAICVVDFIEKWKTSRYANWGVGC